MIKHYLKIKQDFVDMLVFYRMGDFYELFFSDAEEASKLLGIALTSRGNSGGEAIKMAGVPYHAIEQYLAKLVKLNKSIVIVDQIGTANNKGPVERKVTKIITPGTLTDTLLLNERSDNIICSLYKNKQTYGIAYLSLASGKFCLTQDSELNNQLDRYKPSEIIVPESLYLHLKQLHPTLLIKSHPDWHFDSHNCKNQLTIHFATKDLSGFGVEQYPLGIIAAGVLLEYVKQTQSNDLKYINNVSYIDNGNFLGLDAISRNNLEINCTISGEKSPTLLSSLDNCSTNMGSRTLFSWLNNPLRNHAQINARLDSVKLLTTDTNELAVKLKQISDIERITSRIALRSAKPRDLSALRDSLKILPELYCLSDYSTDYLLSQIYETISKSTLEEIKQRLIAAIHIEPANFIRDGYVINDKYNEQLDYLRSIQHNCDQFLHDMEQKERERTQINNLKIEYNKVHGFYIEITNSHLDKSPPDYRRTQTLKNAERFTTSTLKQFEQQVLTSQENAINLEKTLYEELLDYLAGYVQLLYLLANAIATLDVLNNFALKAVANNYTYPELVEDNIIHILKGRHLVVEKQVEQFIANDINLNSGTKFLLITGPNMGGKSTYMRQTAIIVLLAHCGCFVPAEHAIIGNVDRIFTRIGASDDLSSGKSTFMIEMTETANILNNATANSLILIDEIGRGTSTYDGLALAHAIARCLIEKTSSYTLFATHYFELTALEKYYARVKNIHLSAIEHEEKIIFLHHVNEGHAEKSYGIQVASLAGIPRSVIAMAKKYLRQLETKIVEPDLFNSINSITENNNNTIILTKNEQNILDMIQNIDPNGLTARQALDFIYQLKTIL